jgi:NAD(P)H-flavin reductase
MRHGTYTGPEGEILVKRELTPVTKLFEVSAPAVAQKAQPGEFVIVRADERGERIPLTIADFDRERGTITLVVQEVGKTTMQMGPCSQGIGSSRWPGRWAGRPRSRSMAR